MVRLRNTFFWILGASGLFSLSVHAQSSAPQLPVARAASEVTTPFSWEELRGWSVGARRSVGPSQFEFLTLGALRRVGPHVSVGGHFGLDSDGDQFLIGALGRYDLIGGMTNSLFLESDFSFVRGSSGATDEASNGVLFSALFGFDHAFSAQFRVSLAYGLHLGFGDYFGDLVGLTNVDPLGVAAVRWVF
jgi:hypothetical protein